LVNAVHETLAEPMISSLADLQKLYHQRCNLPGAADKLFLSQFVFRTGDLRRTNSLANTILQTYIAHSVKVMRKQKMIAALR